MKALAVFSVLTALLVAPSAGAHGIASKHLNPAVRGLPLGHLYLTDSGTGQAGSGKLLQFDVVNGIAVEPGRVLLRGLHDPIGVAVGPDGLVYVAEAEYKWHAIDVYRVTGSTVQLLRKMTFGDGFQPEPEYLAVDDQDYLYASMDLSNVAVFRPHQHGYVQRPHYLYNTGGAFEIGVDELGDVYQPTLNTMYVHPGRPGKTARAGTRPVVPAQRGWSTLMFARAYGRELFVGTGTRSRSWISVGVLPIHTWGHVSLKRYLALERGCWTRLQIYGLAIAVANGFLYEVCGYINRSNQYIRRIWTYRSTGDGPVRPLNVVRADVWTPGDIAIGP
ncbi:MAG: hypothetical protein JO043_01295 [Candidatus Eremiobacteraeota bacterium]|nr:hypothetical protein [Candidatus Eremiobacteraeota bacterium]